MATYTHDAVATIGEYTDRQTGAVKKRYLNVGKVFSQDDGRMSIKFDCVPAGPEWSGWISLYPAKDQQQPASAPAPAQRQAQSNRSDLDDEIQF